MARKDLIRFAPRGLSCSRSPFPRNQCTKSTGARAHGYGRKITRQYNLVPRYLIDVSRRDQSVDLLGHRYDSPIGISPTGLAGLFRPDADCLLALAAVDHNIPYLMSSASNHSIETR